MVLVGYSTDLMFSFFLSLVLILRQMGGSEGALCISEESRFTNPVGWC